MPHLVFSQYLDTRALCALILRNTQAGKIHDASDQLIYHIKGVAQQSEAACY
jgi:hypothetical protein